VRSADGGQAWGEAALIARDPAGQLSFEEPTLACAPNGHLLAILRCGEPGRYEHLYQARSDDEGHTWLDLKKTPMWGHPAHLLVLADGRLLCSYGYRRPPFGVRACVSRDQGLTWDIEHEIVLRDDGGSRDVGYPSSAQLADGSIVTVYYIHGPDGIRHIAATRWRLE
jgi:sialidase-1